MHAMIANVAAALVGAALMLDAAPVAAHDGSPALPPRLLTGQPAHGELLPDSPLDEEGYPYNDWVFLAAAGDRVIIDLRSRDFDAYLIFGQLVDGRFEEIAYNDDGGSGTDARLVLPVLEGGEYIVRVQSFWDDDFGSYTLLLSDAGVGAFRRLEVGVTVEADLDDRAPSFADDERFELWSFTARAGERLTIDLRSDDFDTVLTLVMFRDGEFTELGWDDDGGEGTNSRIEFTAPDTGEFVLMVESYDDSGRGSYTLRVGSADAPTVARRGVI